MFESYITNGKYLIALAQTDQNTWAAYGSRKVHKLSFERQFDYDHDLFDYYKSVISPANASIEVSADIADMTMTTASSPLAALGALFDALTQQEKEEAEQKRQIERKRELERFGGEIDEELVRKIVKWRKKQAKKKQEESEPDEWDF